MLIIPPDIFLLELLSLLRRGRRVGDLRDEVGGGSLGDAVDEYAEEGDFQENEECDCEAVEYAGAVGEP